MGEYADMMLDGTLCECCGGYIGRATGYPQYCSRECAEARGAATPLKAIGNKRKGPRATCPKCKVRVMKIGLAQHMKDKHGI